MVEEVERQERIANLRAEMERYIRLKSSTTDSRVNRDFAEQIEKLRGQIQALGGTVA